MSRLAIVTGGAGGIGAAIAAELATLGNNVAILDINKEAAQETAEKISDSVGRDAVIGVEADISDDASSETALNLVVEQLGPVSILVNNVGWDRIMGFLETDSAFWDKVIAVNMRGPIALTHKVIPMMLEAKWGRIINIASDAGRVGSSGEAVYSACKAGMIGFSKTLAREFARANITSNAVCPGPTDTPLLNNQLGEGETGRKIYEGLKRAIPMKRLGQPEDLAGMVGFLAGDKASFITGQTISVSGGLTMNG
ncbi:glucose 1-dehydrogenase [Sneathiella chungangensis]|uniref:Glucose 1-dehydrogenase n=1 Tax=Sneathiella chungangensis TaxID=1418234 RepID=A0A845MIW8_9PROT|nr:glucose 1-dehydrogenase [Sneathiella chungangensis]MZR23237.1 glucose 1-dehydrogenase [Sneathiella chungangensis]